MLWCTSAGRVRLTRAKLSSYTHPLGLQLGVPTHILEGRLLKNCLPVNLIPSERPADNGRLRESPPIPRPCAAQSYPMRYYSVAHCRAFLWILDDSSLCTVPAPVDCLPSVASPCDIADRTRGGGHSEGSLAASGGTSIVTQAASRSCSILIVALNISLWGFFCRAC
jgi:hypothetical protein